MLMTSSISTDRQIAIPVSEMILSEEAAGKTYVTRVAVELFIMVDSFVLPWHVIRMRSQGWKAGYLEDWKLGVRTSMSGSGNEGRPVQGSLFERVTRKGTLAFET